MGGNLLSMPASRGPTVCSDYRRGRNGARRRCATTCATTCARMCWSSWAIRVPCWSLMRPAFSSKGQSRWGSSGSTGGRRAVLVIENCQMGVFLTYAAPEGHVLLDRELYLPREWADDSPRRQEARVPQEVRFATKPQLARRMLERALVAGVPAAWVTGDSMYGGDRRLRVWLEQQGQPFVLAVTSAEPLFALLAGHWGQPRADRIAAHIPANAWRRLWGGRRSEGATLLRLGPCPPGATPPDGRGAALGSLVARAPEPQRPN
jgi:hypothetical protein